MTKLATRAIATALAFALDVSAMAQPPAVPAGGFQTRDDASRALAEARRQIGELDRVYAGEQEQCQRRFAVNACLDSARERYGTHKRQLESVELAAKDAQRRFDAAERAARRAQEPVEDPAERARREAEARERFDARQRAARADEEQRQARDAQAPARKARSEQRAREQAQPGAPADDPAVRAQNLQRYQERQRAADEYARRKADERAENERKRAQRAAENARKQ